MGLDDGAVEFYIPEELIGKACPREYLAFLLAKISLNNISEYTLINYLEYRSEYCSDEECTKDDWIFMEQKSGLRKAYDNLCVKFRELYNTDLRLTQYPNDYRIIDDGPQEDRIIQKAEKKNESMWTLDSMLDIDAIMKFITSLGFTNFKESGVRLVMYEY